MNSRRNLKGNAVYVVDGARTPFLKARNGPGPFHASDLALAAAQAVMLRSPVKLTELDHVIIGCVSSGPDEANIARVVALRLGCGDKVPAYTVQRNCASGMQAIDNAALDIASGRADIILAGGTEAMSHHPVLWSEPMVAWLGAWSSARSFGERMKVLGRLRPGLLKPVIGLLRGLTDPVVGLSMGQTAENLATRFGISRTAMDAYAVRSHQRLAAAIDRGDLSEVIPLFDGQGKVYAQDDGLRPDSSPDKLARLRPVFDRPDGRVTAGNSAQVTDGAACVLLASAKAVKQYALPVLGRIVDTEWAGLDPSQMGLGPVHAIAPLLKRHKLDTADIDAWEINEAFAAQVLACQAAWVDEAYCQEALGLKEAMSAIPDDKLNLDGGGVSLGHPVGASGARIILHVLKILQRQGGGRGIASLCIGGGQGGAVLVETVETVA